MRKVESQVILYGIANQNKIIEKIIREIEAEDCKFDIRLILSEVLTNAYKHGNCGRVDIPIYLRYSCEGGKAVFEIEDSGGDVENLVIPCEISDDKILDDNGRGLFLVNCYADKIEYKKNKVIISKQLQKKQKGDIHAN